MRPGLKGYPIFYCPANQTVYSSAGSTAEYGRRSRLAGYWIAFHEYAHHVQRRIGVLAAAYTRDEDQLQISRRIELQADCFMAHDRDLGAHHPARRDRPGRDGGAGARPCRTRSTASPPRSCYWINRGFGTDDFGRCSTWTATRHIG